MNLAAVRLLFVTAFLAFPAIAFSSSAEQANIEKLERTWTAAIKNMNVAEIMSCYVQDESSKFFDVATPLEYTGTSAWRRNWEIFFPQHVKSIEKAEALDIRAQSSGEVAFVSLLQHFILTDAAGARSEIMVRVSHGLRKVDGRWQIAHEHSSFPVEWRTGQADVFAKPKE